MARQPKHETIALEAQTDESHLPPDYPAVGRIRSGMLANAAQGTPAELAAAVGADPSLVSQAFLDLRAVGYVLERDDVTGRYRVANLDHVPQPIPPKTPTPRKTRGHRATVAGNSAEPAPAKTVTVMIRLPASTRVSALAAVLEQIPGAEVTSILAVS